MTEAEWTAIWTYAGAVKAAAGDAPTILSIVGRSITYLVNRLVKFYAQHSATLNPALTQLAIAAFQAMAAAQPSIQSINPPGPP